MPDNSIVEIGVASQITSAGNKTLDCYPGDAISDSQCVANSYSIVPSTWYTGSGSTQHIEAMTNTLAVPLVCAYCFTIFVIAGFLILWLNLRSKERIARDRNLFKIKRAEIECELDDEAPGETIDPDSEEQ